MIKNIFIRHRTVRSCISLMLFQLLAVSPVLAERGLLPLEDAAREGALSDLVQHHLNGEGLEQVDRVGNTLLHTAAEFGQLATAGWLIEQGLDPDQRNEFGATPADLAEANDHDLVVAFLRNRPLERASPPQREEADLPALQYRAWASETGQSVEAAFIMLDRDQVVLKDRDDQRRSVPMGRLTWRDQIIARRMAGLPETGSPVTIQRGVSRGRRAADARVFTAFGSDCLDLLIDAIGEARREILIAIYTMTNMDISEALEDAAKRGVAVHVKYDEKQVDLGSMAEIIDRLKAQTNITVTPVQMSRRFASMHHKFAVFDQASVFTGSFNFTIVAATQSYENSVLIHSDTVARLFTDEFEAIESR